MYLALTVIIGGGIYCTGSFAGMILWFPATAASLFLFKKAPRRIVRMLTIALALSAASGAAAWNSGWFPAMDTSFGWQEGDRLNMASGGIVLTRAYWPSGSGLGTLEQVYHLIEDPRVIGSSYVNHLHNDYIEWLVELGAFGALMLVGFLVLWARLAWQAWRDPGGEMLWPRTASIVTGLILLHSFVDYPLRTPAMLTVFCLYWLALCSPDRSKDIETGELINAGRSRGGRQNRRIRLR